MNQTTRIRLSVLFAAAALTLAACGGSGDRSSRPITSDCAIPQQNQAVFNVMLDYYLWYRDMPRPDPRGFSSPDALLEALRVNPPDRFSYLTTVAEEEALFGSSQFVGLGFRSQTTGSVVRAVDVFEDGPAARAGLVRGSTLLAVNGVPIAQVLASPGGFSGALGPAEAGVEVTFLFRNPDGIERLETLVKAVVTIPPVTAARVFPLGGRTTGYLAFRNFVEPSVPALDAAFEQFAAADVTQLVVDLRYNSGGLVSVLQHFADLLGSRIAGPGAVFASYRHNDKQRSLDTQILFPAEPIALALPLEKIVFITTGSTASAAEMLINGMSPYVTTTTVGSATFGKPVGQYGFVFCQRVLRPVSFELVNALGEGGYFDGIPAQCPADDGLDFGFGVPGEASFDAAVAWLEHGFCPNTAQAFTRGAEPTGGAPPPAAERRPWRINDAH